MNKTGSKILHGMLLATSAMVASPVIVSTVAMANPAGGTVAVGSATITNPSATQTVINQSSKRALINWNSFNIGSGSSVVFNQPNAKSLTVNRVTGPGNSTIDGSLFANGNIWLLNANGILFGRGSQINVGSLLATTSELSDSDFKAGKNNFTASPNPNASVVNQGTITVSRGGSVVLSAPQVSNEGLIQADLGTVVLGGAQAFTVDMTGDNLLRYEISAPVTQTPTDSNGSAASALVSNSGTIAAAGGHVLMTARAARNVEDSVINNTGMVEATSVSVHDGEVDIDAGDGTVNVGGTVDVSGSGNGQTGGTVTVTGSAVNVADGAKINASGGAGGGTVLIGGGPHGTGALAHAQRTIIGAATITADATVKGNGGNVTVWSDGNTQFNGSISAKGGAKGGNGGQVETSGRNLGVGVAAKVDTSAPLGLTGDWLLDPQNIDIVDSFPNSGITEAGLTNGTLAVGTDSGQTDYILNTTIVSQLGSTNVTLEASNEIDVDADLTYSSSHALNLLAEGEIDVAANIQNCGSGNINLIAGWDGTTTSFTAPLTASVYGNGGGSVVVSSSATVGSSSGVTTLAGYDVDLNSGTGLGLVNGGDLYIDTKHDAALTGDITGLNITVSAVGNVSAGNITDGPDGGGGFNAASNINITSTNGTIADAGAVVGANVTLNAKGDITQTGGYDGTTFSATSTAGNITLLNDNDFDGVITLSAANGSAKFGNNDNTTIGAITTKAAGDVMILSEGNLTVTTSIVKAGSGNIALVGGWDGTTVDTANLTLSGAYGNVGSTSGNVVIGGTGSVSVGSQSGTTLVEGHDITLNTNGGVAQIGYTSDSAGGDITINAVGSVYLNGGANATYEAQIGDGATFAHKSSFGNITIVAGSVQVCGTSFALAGNNANITATNGSIASGSKSLIVALNTLAIPYVTYNGSAADAYISSPGGGISIGNGVNGIQTNGGKLVLSAAGNITQTSSIWAGNATISTSSGNIVLTSGGNMIEAVYLAAPGNATLYDYETGDVFLTGGNVVQNLTVLTKGELDVIGDVQDSSGSVLAVAGWDGNLSITTAANIASHNDYGANGSALYVGDSAATDGASLGGVNGTTVFASDVNLVSNVSTAQLGYAGASSGNISVTASGDVSVSADDSCSGDCTAFIGNGGSGVAGNVSGNIAIAAGGGVFVTAYQDDSAFAGIGNEGAGSKVGGTINITAGTGVSVGNLFGGSAVIGNEGSGNGIVVSGDISITANGTLGGPDGIITGGEGFSQIGNTAYGSGAQVGGNITVTANHSGIDVYGDLESAASGHIGNFAFGANGTSASGNILVQANGGDLTLYAGADDGLASIGNVGEGSAISGNVTVTASGAVNITSEGDNSVAQIGHTGAEGSGNITGTINVSAGGDVLLTADPQTGVAAAFIGHGDVYGIIGGEGSLLTGNISGNIVVSAGGNVSFHSDYGLTQIGHASAGSTLGGNINVTAQGEVYLDAEEDGSAQIGHYDDGDDATVNGNISVTANGSGGVNLTTGAEGFYAQIGHYGDGDGALVGGNITVTANNGDVSLAAAGDGNGSGSLVEIGHQGSFSSGANISGNILINANGSLWVSSTDDDTLAQVGNGGFAEDASVTGNITVNVTGEVAVTADASNICEFGCDNGAFATIGNGDIEGSFFTGAGTSAVIGGNITIIAGGNVTLDAADGLTQIGNIGDGVSVGGAINVTAANGVSLTSEAGGSAQIGNVGENDDILVGGDIHVTANGSGGVGINVDSDGYSAGIGNYGIGDGAEVGGNITVAANAGILDMQNAASGEIALIGNQGFASGDPDVAGNINVSSQGMVMAATATEATTQIGNNGYAGGGTLSGDISVTTYGTGNVNLVATGSGAVVQIGNGARENDGPVSGNIKVTSAGFVNLNATVANGTSYAVIGNGDPTGDSTGSVSGDITVLSTLDLYLTEGNGVAWIGNFAGSDDGDVESGNVTIVASAITANDFTDMILDDLGSTNVTGGNVFVGLTSLADDNLGDIIYDSPHTLSLASAGNVNVDSSTIQNDGAGALNIIAGWDKTTRNVASLTNAGVYGNNNGNVTLDAGEGTASVGSFGGKTTVAGHDINLIATYGAAQIGDSDLGTTGAIKVAATGNVTLDATGAHIYDYAQIGNSGSGAITVNAAGNILLESGSAISNYAQIGDGGGGASFATRTGDIRIGATNVTLLSDEGYTQIGDGGASSRGNTSANITITASGNVNVAGGGDQTWGYALIGNGGDSSVGNDVGNISVNATGNVSITGGGDYAQIGNGGWGSSGNHTGNVSVKAGGNLLLQGSNGAGEAYGSVNIYGYAQIGNGGWGAAGPNAGNIVVNANGNLQLTAGNGGMYVQIGNGGGPVAFGNGTSSSSSGNITVTAGNLTLTGGTKYGTAPIPVTQFAQIGNSAVNGTANGDISINVTGLTDLSSQANGGWVWVGNEASNGTFAGNVTIITGDFGNEDDEQDDLAIMAGVDLLGGAVTIGVTDISADPEIGGFSYSSPNTLTLLAAGSLSVIGDIENTGTGNITVVVGWKPTVAPASVATTPGAYGNNNATLTIGGADAQYKASLGSAGGTTTVLTKNLTIDGVNAMAQLGYRGATSGAIKVNATGDILVETQGNELAQIGNGGINVTSAVGGSVTVNAGGNITLNANGSPSAAVIGNLGGTSASVGGNITVTAGKAVKMGGNIAVIGDVTSNGTTVNGSMNGAVNVTAASLTGGSTAQITGNAAKIVLTGAGNSIGAANGKFTVDVNKLAIQTNNGSAYIASPTQGFSVGVGSSGIDLGSGNFVATAAGGITQTAAIDAGAVNISTSNGDITLINTGNTIGAASLSASGNVSLADAVDLTLTGATAGGDLSLATEGNLTIVSSVQLQNGNITAVAGWNGVPSGTYGDNGSITIGGSGASGGVAFGSKNGTTTLDTDDLLLSAINGYAQVGYHGGGSGAILVNATGDITLNGGTNAAYFAQIGDGGYQVSGNNSGAITVLANGNVTLNAGSGQEAYAQIGNGGAESNSNTGGYTDIGAITLTGGTIALNAGSGSASYAQVGNGGYKSGQGLNGVATVGGDVVINAVSAVGLNGNAADAYAQIGNGGDFINDNAASGSSGTINGNISVTVSNPVPAGNAITMLAGTGANSYVQIGDGGQGENTPASGGTVSFSVGGDISIADLVLTGSNSGPGNGYAQIGNGDASSTGTGNVSGDITINHGTSFHLTNGSAPDSQAMIGNDTGQGTVSGTITGYNGGSSAPASNPSTAGTISNNIQNNTLPTNYIFNGWVVIPYIPTPGAVDTGSGGPTPLEKLAGNGDDEVPSDGVAKSVSDSLDGKGHTATKSIIPGVLEEIVTLTPRNPHGIPPADEDYSSWGNEAFWRW